MEKEVFTVFGTITYHISINVRANSCEEAINIAKANYVDFNINQIYDNQTLCIHSKSIRWTTAYGEDES